MNWKRLGAAATLVVAIGLSADSCNNASTAEQSQADSQLNTYNHNQPIHKYQYSAERAELQQLIDLRVKGQLNTWSVWVANNGTPLGMCPSKGFPIPYSTELTNPWQASAGGPNAGTGNVAIGQMDPQGTFPSQSTLATWVMCLSPDGSIHPQYLEPMVMTYTHEVSIEGGKIVDKGAPSGDSALTVKP